MEGPSPLAALLLASALASAPAAAGVLVAARPIARGAVIQPQDVRLASGGVPSAGALAAPADAIGLVARRAIFPGVAIRAAALAPPNRVARGALVVVRSQGAGFVVEATATARGAGAAGETVAAKNRVTGASLRGRVGEDGVLSLDR